LSYPAHNSGQYFVISLGWLRKHKHSTANIAGVPTQVWMSNLLHTSQKQCCFIQIFLSVFLETRVFCVRILFKGNFYWIIAVTAENSQAFRIWLLSHFRESAVWDKLTKL